jgi:D-inositol-3-phosphate glycosyltransferase
VSLRIGMISEHASPLALLGGVDSGGQNVYVGQLARHLGEMGYEIEVLTRRDDPSLPETVDLSPGAKVVHVPAGPAGPLPKEDLLEHMGEFTDFVLARARRRGYDLLHANFWMSGLVAADVKRALGIPFVVTFHALGRVRRLHQGDADRFPDARFTHEDRICAEADGLIAECPQDFEDLSQLYCADPARIVTIPCGFDPAELWPVDKQTARRKLGLPAEQSLVLQLGRMVPRKGVDTVIRGFARLGRTHGIDARLLIVGGESDEPDPRLTPEIGRLQGVAREEKVERAVTFAGRRGRHALRHYYSAADVFVTTPLYEPFGITPLEAMACGTPVVGSAVGGVQWTVKDGETGFLVPPGEPDVLADRLARLYRQPELRHAMGRQGIQRVQERFTWSKVAESVAAFYDAVVDRTFSATSTPARRTAAPPPADPDVPGILGVVGALSGTRTQDTIGAIDRAFASAIETFEASRRLLPAALQQAADTCVDCFRNDGKLLICGNGGSAADAQHLAAELVGRFKLSGRGALPALALCADMAVMTAWANDVGYDAVFSRQVEAFGRPGDVLLGISTSGRSKNVVQVFETARSQGLRTVALLGGDGGEVGLLADTAVVVPSNDTQHIQETQILLIHVLCELIESQLGSGSMRTQTMLQGVSI